MDKKLKLHFDVRDVNRRENKKKIEFLDALK